MTSFCVGLRPAYLKTYIHTGVALKTMLSEISLVEGVLSYAILGTVCNVYYEPAAKEIVQYGTSERCSRCGGR